MSDEEIDREFRSVADAFIHLANEKAKTAPRENVAMALLYAAARFNSFVIASHAADLKAYRSDRPRATEFFVGEYQKMLAENLVDYEKIYDQRYAHLMRKE